MTDQIRLYDRLMMRSAFQSLFWVIFLARKRQEKLTKKALADKLGINKSFASRAFNQPPNWQIDTISDVSDALGVDLVIEARDRATGVVYTPAGIREPATTSSAAGAVPHAGAVRPDVWTLRRPHPCGPLVGTGTI